jgi:hypothetical protein
VSIGSSPAASTRICAEVAGVRFYEAWHLSELSLVERGANREACFEV